MTPSAIWRWTVTMSPHSGLSTVAWCVAAASGPWLRGRAIVVDDHRLVEVVDSLIAAPADAGEAATSASTSASSV